MNYKKIEIIAASVCHTHFYENAIPKPLRFAYKSCVSFTKVAFYLQIVHLRLQTCISFSNCAFYFTNVVSRFTIQQSLMCSKEEYFKDFDYNSWIDYVIIEDGKIISRAGIWKRNDSEWEVAGVSTLPQFRRKGYGETVIRHCIAKIIESGKIATCSTKATNIPMIKTAVKAGFKAVE